MATATALARSTLRRPIVSHIYSKVKTMSTFPSRLVEHQQLATALASQHHSTPTSSIIPVCATWFLPNDPKARTGRAEYNRLRIPGARFFDLDQVCDSSSPYPHMLPEASVFESAMQALGINNQDTIVVYDSAELGLFSAPRVAWTFDVFGHERVHVLNNFKQWVEEGHPTEQGESAPVQASQYKVRGLDETRIAAFDEVEQLVMAHYKDVQIIDARPHGRWAGSSPEPRPGLPSGHMPGSINIEFGEVLDPHTKTMQTDRRKLRALFEGKGVSADKPIVVSCGTGVTAAVVEAALQHAGYDTHKRIYDGSWTEWAQRAAGHEELITKA